MNLYLPRTVYQMSCVRLERIACYFHLCSLGTETQLVRSMLANLCPQRPNEPVSDRNFRSGFESMKFLVSVPAAFMFPGVPSFPFYFSKETNRRMAEV